MNMRITGAGLVLLALAGMVWAVLVAQATARECRADRVELISGSREVGFDVELAITPEEQARGLMFRPSLAREAGMLFLMDPPRPAHFWMRNTMISLDLLFIDRSGRVVNIAAKAVPYSQTPLRSQGPVRAVLEINGGLAAELGIGPGSQAVHPAFDLAPGAFRCAG
ncbi:MAG: DUF192 domain-containing protein [Pseudomonadota bacterium]